MASNRLPRFPLYVVSKARWESRLTNRALAAMGVPHFVVVEPDEAAAYRAAIEAPGEVLELDMEYKSKYDTCDDLGDAKGRGPGGARNFAWAHSRLEVGADWHWVMDDNISGFYRFNYNLKTPCTAPAYWRAMEDFALRYENVAMAGPNYFMFVLRKTTPPAYTLNTRIYSCNLIRNALPYRWRGRYNEDTDLSLRMLKDGWATVQFNAFLQYKMPTQTVAGGNTAEFYDAEGTRPKSEMLARLHPDVARVVEKFGRIHHEVDYGWFKDTQLKLAAGVALPAERGAVDDYGMVLEQRGADGIWRRTERGAAPERRKHYATGGET